MKKKIINSIEDILFNNYKINLEEGFADKLIEKRDILSKELLNKSTLANILHLTNSIKELIVKNGQETDEFKSLIDRFLKMDNALNRDETLNQILNDK